MPHLSRTRALLAASPLALLGLAVLSGPPVLSSGMPPVKSAQADPAAVELFETKIRPVLAEKCYSCHGPKIQQAGLRLDSVGAIRKGGENGPLFTPGKPQGSLLLRALHHDGLRMPPQGKLPAPVIAAFESWIRQGAALPQERAVRTGPNPTDMAAGRKHWAFQPVRELALPKVRNRSWPSRKIDHFVLARLEAQRFTPSPEADPRALIRRVTFDLTGLSPTPEEVEQFVREYSAERSHGAGMGVWGSGRVGVRKSPPMANRLPPVRGAGRPTPTAGRPTPTPAPKALTTLVDRLLASPAYGERWARHWLDVARYADDNPTSEATNPPAAYPWRYRDWVVRSLNEDLPYDQFLRRQLAADLMPDLPPTELAALGFLGISPVYHKELKLARDVVETIAADEWDERLDTVSRGFMGLTVACARCHDHKFDPITTKDYYALAGVMASTQLIEWPLVKLPEERALALSRLEGEIRGLERDLRGKRRQQAQARGNTEKLDREIAELEKKIEERKKEAPDYGVPMASVVRDAGLWVDGSNPSLTRLDVRPNTPRDLPVFIRGDVKRPGPVVPRRFLQVLSRGEPQPFRRGSGRLELAEAMLTDAAPLTARVIVNRVWGWHFGRPLVDTPSNFGRLGGKPSHPELLDDLAARFIKSGWSLKWLHREIVLSSTYRQASRNVPAYYRKDADNRLLWRMNPQRLEPEQWRDAVLQITGRLDPTLGGPSEDLESGRGRGGRQGRSEQESRRRTLYGRVSRQRPADILRLFDFPDANRHGEQRTPTTTPLQQLYFLNSPFFLQHSDVLAEKVLSGTGASPVEKVRSLFRTVLLRQPKPAELRMALELVRTGGADERASWSVLAQSLLASNEFLFLD